MKVQRKRQNPQEGSFESKDLYQTLSKAFETSKATAKVSPKQLREDDQELVRKARRSPVERSLRKPYQTIIEKVETRQMLEKLLLKEILKALARQESQAILRQLEGLEPSPFLGTGCMQAYFQHEGKVDVERQRRKNLTRQDVSTETQFLRTIGGTPSRL